MMLRSFGASPTESCNVLSLLPVGVGDDLGLDRLRLSLEGDEREERAHVRAIAGAQKRLQRRPAERVTRETS